jgi:hypothetical protein
MVQIYKLHPSQTQAWGRVSDFHLADDGTQEAIDAPERDEWEDTKANLRDLLTEIQEGRLTVSTRTRTVGMPARYLEVHEALNKAIENGGFIGLRRPNDVPLHSILRFAAFFTAIICLGSLAMWLADMPPIINPFISLLGLVLSPFLYAMGQAARIKF